MLEMNRPAGPAGGEDTMRLATYDTGEGLAPGIVEGGKIRLFPGRSMLEIISGGPLALSALQRERGSVRPLDPSRLRAPIPEPRRNIFAVGLNYREHARESAAARGKELKLPDRPVFFTKASTSINSPFGDIPFPSKVTSQLDWEVELGVVIGTGGRDISRQEALRHVFGYLVINDVSARDVQAAHGGQFFKGKSLDGFCPAGPWIVTADEIPDPHRLGLRCLVNGAVKQQANTSDFIFGVPEMLEWLSLGLTLLPGDLLATGTPSGVGFARTPPEFLRDGDVVECSVEEIGALRNRVRVVNSPGGPAE